MSPFPVKYNAGTVSILSIISALGIVARISIQIPLIPGLLVLTPGFLFSQLGGIIAGIPGGFIVGAIVGIGGAIAGGEPPLLPFIGNIFLGLGTGWVLHVISDRESKMYYLLVILGGALIGGFIPSLIIYALTESIEMILLLAFIDCFQACIWAIGALIINRVVILPLASDYIYPSTNLHQLEEKEEDHK
jgi:LytS/YehU family sensor histidine kinase